MATIAILIQNRAYESHHSPFIRATKSMEFVLERLSGDEIKKTIDLINNMVNNFPSPLKP